MTTIAPPRVYLASRWGRREELQRYKAILELKGVTVTSRWLTNANSDIEAMIEDDTNFSPAVCDARAKVAAVDLKDILDCDTLIAFSEPRDSKCPPRGGRHVEFGLGMALQKRIIVVGPRENIFHWSRGVNRVDNLTQAIELLFSKNPADEVYPFMFFR